MKREFDACTGLRATTMPLNPLDAKTAFPPGETSTIPCNTTGLLPDGPPRGDLYGRSDQRDRIGCGRGGDWQRLDGRAAGHVDDTVARQSAVHREIAVHKQDRIVELYRSRHLHSAVADICPRGQGQIVGGQTRDRRGTRQRGRHHKGRQRGRRRIRLHLPLHHRRGVDGNVGSRHRVTGDFGSLADRQPAVAARAPAAGAVAADATSSAAPISVSVSVTGPAPTTANGAGPRICTMASTRCSIRFEKPLPINSTHPGGTSMPRAGLRRAACTLFKDEASASPSGPWSRPKLTTPTAPPAAWVTVSSNVGSAVS